METKPPNLPVYLAGLGPQMTKLVGKISDGVFINMATPEKVKEIAARVREGALGKRGVIRARSRSSPSRGCRSTLTKI